MSELGVVDVSLSFGATRVLDQVSLDVARGEIVALLGPSGSGKSSLLRVVAGIQPADSGRVLLDGEDITSLPTHRRHIGMVFQDNQLFPHRTVMYNVSFGLKMAGVARADRERRAGQWLNRVGLPDFGARKVTELSGGEAKRVALARTMVTEPRVVLLDEPLTGLDRELHDRLALELAAILRDSATTALLVTHDPEEATVIADRVVSMQNLSSSTTR